MLKDFAFGLIPIDFSAKKKRYLLVQHHAGHWGFPKGHPNKNEADIDAACREFEEETGINDYKIISDTKICESYYMNKKNKEYLKTVCYYLAKVKTTKTTHQKSEIQNIGWFTKKEVFKKLDYDEAKEVFRKALVILDE